MAAQPEAGWYDDGTGRQRWWDGRRWTEEFIDLRERDVELHTGAIPQTGAAAPADWYDDGRGRQRWWDGARWTTAFRFSGEEREFAGIVVDGRWIHLGPSSHPVGGASASYVSGAELLKRGRLAKPAVARTLFGPSGLITPNQLKRTIDGGAGYVLVELADQVWIAAVGAGREAEAVSFASWITRVGDHYRYG